jgi:hypothetical protein
MHNYHITMASSNGKTGPIPVTTTSSDSCPPDCAFNGNGCYAQSGPLNWHWKAVDNGSRSVSLDELCEKITSLPANTLWRHNQAGDLPSDGGSIDEVALDKLIAANAGKRGFTYTHHRGEHNVAMAKRATSAGFTVNLSANTLAEADEFYKHGLPVVVTLPHDAVDTQTDGGIKVKVCPAQKVEGMTCKLCKLCARADRGFVIGFLAHGTSKRRVNIIARG